MCVCVFGGSRLCSMVCVREERGKLMELMNEKVEGWLGMEDNERVAVAMDKACTD